MHGFGRKGSLDFQNIRPTLFNSNHKFLFGIFIFYFFFRFFFSKFFNTPPTITTQTQNINITKFHKQATIKEKERAHGPDFMILCDS